MRRNVSCIAIAPNANCVHPDTVVQTPNGDKSYMALIKDMGLDFDELMTITVTDKDTGKVRRYLYNDDVVVRRNGVVQSIVACELSELDEIV